MGRGKHLKTKVKETKKLMETQAKTRWKLVKKKPLDVSLREHIGKIIDNTKLTDVAELVAVLGLTPIVKMTIEETETLMAKFKRMIESGAWLKWSLLMPLTPYLGFAIETLVTPPDVEMEKIMDLPEVEIFEWILSFAIAFCIVKWGGYLIGQIGDLTKVIGVMLGGAG